MSFVATAIVGSSVVGAGATIYSADKAASAQTNAANNAIALQQQQFGQTQENLAPYRDIGNTAATQLTSMLPTLTTPITMDETTLRNTPGYQFNLTQGLKATQNSAAARGLGVSGAALKGASTYATGLADNTYQNQFNNANTNQTNAYNRLSGLVNTGETAAAGQGVIGQQSANAQSAATIGAGNAQAAASNTTGGAINNLASNIGGYAVYKGLYGNSPTTLLPTSNPGSVYSPLGPGSENAIY